MTAPDPLDELRAAYERLDAALHGSKEVTQDEYDQELAAAAEQIVEAARALLAASGTGERPEMCPICNRDDGTHRPGMPCTPLVKLWPAGTGTPSDDGREALDHPDLHEWLLALRKHVEDLTWSGYIEVHFSTPFSYLNDSDEMTGDFSAGYTVDALLAATAPAPAAPSGTTGATTGGES